MDIMEKMVVKEKVERIIIAKMEKVVEKTGTTFLGMVTFREITFEKDLDQDLGPGLGPGLGLGPGFGLKL